jgi:SAM-dependent methyltransferase
MPANARDSAFANCPVCDSNEWIMVREGTDLCRPEYKVIFKLARCSSCGHVMQNPIPDESELNAAYAISDAYIPYRPAWKESRWTLWRILRVWTIHRRKLWLKRWGTGHEMLEVGCGSGDFMLAAHDAGWNVCALEYNSSIVEMICKDLPFDVRVGGLATGIWKEAQFDLIAVFNVLEHLRDPQQALSTAAAYLHPGGKIFLQIPTRQAAENGKWFGQYWAPLDFPRHLHFFDRATLSLICDKAGFDMVVYKTPVIQSAWCYFASSWRWSNRRGKSSFSCIRYAAVAALVILAMPYISIQSMRKRVLEAFAVAVRR